MKFDLLCQIVRLWWLSLALLMASNPAVAVDPMTFGRGTLAIETAKGSYDFAVELAETPQQKSRGLMFRESMAADAGMLFVYSRPQVITMWMRNTYIPLDMLFIARDGRIAHIAQNAVPRSDRTISSHARVTGVLELNGGTARRLGIAVGDRVRHAAFGNAADTGR
ncbi:MAG: DUF192 domain-containing protein [Alphaproteobacteria bacterium]|jgi:uncharacterized membrane protein (UPF0127 family)